MVVFTKDKPTNKAIVDDYKDLCTKAYNRPSELFGINLGGGVHGLQIETALKLIQILDVDCGETSWELGCGEGNLAFCLSAVADGATVVATDIGENSFVKFPL